MKILFKMMTVCALLVGFMSCSKQEEVTDQPLEVNYIHLHGTWKLEEVNGKPTPEGVYCYIELQRDEHRFKMYDNFNTMYARLNTGSFELIHDVHKGDKISGKYDFGRGDWKDEYMVTDLMPEGTMVWTGVSNPEDVQKFVRCEAVPEEIVEEARQEK